MSNAPQGDPDQNPTLLQAAGDPWRLGTPCDPFALPTETHPRRREARTASSLLEAAPAIDVLTRRVVLRTPPMRYHQSGLYGSVRIRVEHRQLDQQYAERSGWAGPTFRKRSGTSIQLATLGC